MGDSEDLKTRVMTGALDPAGEPDSSVSAGDLLSTLPVKPQVALLCLPTRSVEENAKLYLEENPDVMEEVENRVRAAYGIGGSAVADADADEE